MIRDILSDLRKSESQKMDENKRKETLLLSFKTICNFINDIADEYGQKYKPIKLYRRLINKTKISNEKIIKRHIDLFHEFCVKNRDALFAQDVNKFVLSNLVYSDNVVVDMKHIFSLSSKQDAALIWQHLLTISARLDPAGNAKEILRKNSESKKDESDGSDFLSSLITKVEQTVQPNASPMEAISSVIQSGLFNELFTGMQERMASGNFDMSKLLGTVNNMVNNLGEQVGDDPEGKKALGMFQNMTSALSGNGGVGNVGGLEQTGGGTNPLALLSTVMGGMNGTGNSDVATTMLQEMNAKREEENKTDKKV